MNISISLDDWVKTTEIPGDLLAFAGIEASEQGGLGVVFLLQHYEHPTELSAVIERRWPGLSYAIIAINLVGELAGAASGSVKGEGGGSKKGSFTQTYLTAEGGWVDQQVSVLVVFLGTLNGKMCNLPVRFCNLKRILSTTGNSRNKPKMTVPLGSRADAVRAG